MIIRHDLKLVFIHVPKCAGKQLREILKTGSDEKNLTELWNFSYLEIMHRYVDMAHLPISDIFCTQYFSYLKNYNVIACCRNPYERLTSSANEYYRQKSKQHEMLVKNKKLTIELKNQYYKSLPRKHHELDPRYIHSLPMHYFTHLGKDPCVDKFMRCESLKTDFIKICNDFKLPNAIRDAAKDGLQNRKSIVDSKEYTKKEIKLANQLYKIDFKTFGYDQIQCYNNEKKECGLAGNIKQIHNKDEIHWHWGPTAMKQSIKLERTRS